MNITLNSLDKSLKKFLSLFLIVLTLGVTIGIVYLNFTTSMSAKGTIKRYNGSDVNEFEIAESYPKPISELLLTTHSHIISFAFIFVLLGIIFYFNSIVTEFWRDFLIIEPLISTIITFTSIWGIRFIHEGFVYITIISASLMYTSFYLMSVISLYELIFKKMPENNFFDRVFEVVAKIPYGKVTTYGAIAEVCGVKSAARTVGWALNSAANSNLPCHRVVNRFGGLSGKNHFGSPTIMKELLELEGVEFTEDQCVDMKKHFWKPL